MYKSEMGLLGDEERTQNDIIFDVAFTQDSCLQSLQTCVSEITSVEVCLIVRVNDVALVKAPP